jgi:hypothetical protein
MQMKRNQVHYEKRLSSVEELKSLELQKQLEQEVDYEFTDVELERMMRKVIDAISSLLIS